MRKIKKYLILCLIPMLLSLFIAESWSFDFGQLAKFLGKSEDILLIYLDDRIIIDDPDEIKICFLPEAEKYPGLSVQELFDEALEQLSLGPEMVLIAAIFNIKSFSWMFLYTKKLGHRRRG